LILCMGLELDSSNSQHQFQWFSKQCLVATSRWQLGPEAVGVGGGLCEGSWRAAAARQPASSWSWSAAAAVSLSGAVLVGCCSSGVGERQQASSLQQQQQPRTVTCVILELAWSWSWSWTGVGSGAGVELELAWSWSWSEVVLCAGLFMVCVGLLWLFTTPGVQQGMWPRHRPSSLALGLATPGLPCIAFCPGVHLSPSWGWNAALLAAPAEMVYVALTACLGVGACACVGCCVPCLHVCCGVSASPEVHSAGSGRFPVANPM
jgi:hypothetical protein